MENLLQEIRDFEEYKNCLDDDLFTIYKEHLVKCSKKLLNEITVNGLADTFKFLFGNDVVNNPETTMRSIDRFKKATLNQHYTKEYNQIVKDSSTNLEVKRNELCDKETFIREFEKLDFDEFRDKADLSIKSTPYTFLKSFLEIYDEDGWLMLDDYENVNK